MRGRGGGGSLKSPFVFSLSFILLNLYQNGKRMRIIGGLVAGRMRARPTVDKNSDQDSLHFILGKYMTTWRGVSLMKDPLDLTILQQLLWELKPRTVFEFGAYEGGSALWFADLLKLFGCESRVLSVDIDLSLLNPVAKKSLDITFIEGDLFEVEKCFPEQLLKVSLKRRIHLIFKTKRTLFTEGWEGERGWSGGEERGKGRGRGRWRGEERGNGQEAIFRILFCFRSCFVSELLQLSR